MGNSLLGLTMEVVVDSKEVVQVILENSQELL